MVRAALGALVYRSGFIPRAIAVLVGIAGAGYFVDSMTQLLAPGVPVASVVTFIGEPALALCLVIRGAADERYPVSTA